MYAFNSITPKEIADLIHSKTPFDVEIPESVTKFKKYIPETDFSKPLEVPPTPIIFTTEGIANVLMYSGDGLDGKYTQFVVFVYAFDGKIHYQILPSGSYKAMVTW